MILTIYFITAFAQRLEAPPLTQKLVWFKG